MQTGDEPEAKLDKSEAEAAEPKEVAKGVPDNQMEECKDEKVQ